MSRRTNWISPKCWRKKALEERENLVFFLSNIPLLTIAMRKEKAILVLLSFLLVAINVTP